MRVYCTHLDQAQSSARCISVCPVGSFTYRIHLNASPQCYGMAVHETVRIASGNTDRIASGNTGKLLKSNSLVRSCMRSSLRYWPMAALVWPEDTQRQVLAPWGLSDSAFSSTSGLVKRQYKAIRMLRRGKRETPSHASRAAPLVGSRIACFPLRLDPSRPTPHVA